MLPENQAHLKNDCVDCYLREYDDKTGQFICYNHVISWYECVRCYQRQKKVEEETRKAKVR